MSNPFHGRMPRTRVNIKLDLFTQGAQKKVELPLKLLSVGGFNNGKAEGTLSEREKINITKNNINSVLAEPNPEVNFTIKNTLANDGAEENVKLSFQNAKYFETEAVTRQILQLWAMLPRRNLLRDLKSNLFDNVIFRKELGIILKAPRCPVNCAMS